MKINVDFNFSNALKDKTNSQVTLNLIQAIVTKINLKLI